MRLLAFFVTAGAGVVVAEATAGQPPGVQLLGVMLVMGALESVLLPLLGDRTGYVIAEMAGDVLLGGALAGILYLSGLASARYLAPLQNLWVLGLVWPMVVFWPKRRRDG